MASNEIYFYGIKKVWINGGLDIDYVRGAFVAQIIQCALKLFDQGHTVADRHFSVFKGSSSIT